MADESVIISNLPTHTPVGSDYLAVEDSSATGKATVNDVVAAATQVQTNKSAIGVLSSLTTSAKSNLVAAINEVDSHADANAAAISSLNSNLTWQSVTLTAGSGVTINSQAAYKIGYLLFVIARITLSSNVSAYATLLTHGLNTRCGWVAPLYTQTSQNFSVYGDAGDTTIRTKQTITAGTYQISCVIPWY